MHIRGATLIGAEKDGSRSVRTGRCLADTPLLITGESPATSTG